MQLHLSTNKVAKIILALLAIIAFIYFIYWLWQRQPKEIVELSVGPTAQNQIVDTKQEDITISTTPDDGKILDSSNTTLAIKSTQNSYVAIISNSFELVAKTDAAGLLQQEEKLDDGLNLVKISVFGTDFSKRVDKKIALYVKDPKTPTSAKTVFTGLVKNIFQSVITLTTDIGEKKVKQSQSTKVAYPSPAVPLSKSPAPKTDQNIRVGDYLVVLGNLGPNDEIAALSIDIVRDNKPQIQKDILVARLLSRVKNNVFSAKNEKGNEIAELSLSKTSQISKDGQETKSEDIQKDKKAIIIYHTDQDIKIVDLIYLLP